MIQSLPTNTERMRKVPWWFSANMLDNVRISLIFGPVIVLFFDALAMDKSRIGILLSLPLFFQALSLFIVPLVERLGYKRTSLIFFSIRSGVLFGLLATPWFMSRFGAGGAFLWVAAVMLIHSVGQAIGLTAWGPWGREILPPAQRGKLVAVNTFLCGAVIIAGTFFAGFWVARHSGLGGFMALIAAGTIAGLLSVGCYLPLPGGHKFPAGAGHRGHLRQMLAAFQDASFVRLLGGVSLFIFIVQAMATFLPLYMKDRVGIPDGQVVHLWMWNWGGILAAVYFWGWATDRFGGKPVLITGFLGHALLPILWYLIPRGHGDVSYWAAAAVSFIGGLMCIAYGIGIDRYLFLTAMPEDKKNAYFAVWVAVTGLAAGLGPIVVGAALDLLRRLDEVGTVLKVIHVDSFLPIFVLHLAMPLLGVYVVSRAKADSETTTTQFVGQLIAGLPFGLFSSMSSVLRFRMAGDEQERIATTRQLGRLDSLFNTDELIAALSDPSFDVRYEAVLAMASRKPNPKITAALLDVLDGEDIELAATAVWALGQIGDLAAIPALRLRLTAPYRVLRARSARALARLGDLAGAPMIFDLLKKEQDLFLKVAFASSLGALRYVPATETILAVLAEVESQTFRREVALAVARLVGNEKNYIRLCRQADEDFAAAVSGAVSKLKRPAKRLGISASLIDSLSACADSFAADQQGMGVELLWPILEAMPKDQIDAAFRGIFAECCRRLGQFGNSRREYILLALHICDVWLSAKCAVNPRAGGA